MRDEMKLLIVFLLLFTTALAAFFLWTWFFPIHIGYKLESPVGFYRFKIVWWGFSNGTTLYVIEELGNTADYVLYLLGQYDPLQ